MALSAIRKASHALILVGTAFFLALALNGPVHWLSLHIPGKARGSRTLATSISFVIIIVLLTAFIASLAPSLIRDSSSFIHNAPQLVSDVHNQNTSLGGFVRKYHLEGQVDRFSSQLSTRLQNSTGTAFTTVTHLTSSVFSMLAILVLTFMMLIEGPSWIELFKRVVPPEKRDHAIKLSQDMYGVVHGYVNGQVLLAVIAGGLIIVPLLILHISYPAALMVIVFISALIPLIGHPIGAVIVTTVALFHSPLSAAIILLYYILYIQIENYVIQPKIQSSNTNLSPLIVLLAVIVGVSFEGLLGGLVAIPVAGCIKILISDYLHNHKLIDQN
jgi:predicted PurR-regulated permease PerM